MQYYWIDPHLADISWIATFNRTSIFLFTALISSLRISCSPFDRNRRLRTSSSCLLIVVTTKHTTQLFSTDLDQKRLRNRRRCTTRPDFVCLTGKRCFQVLITFMLDRLPVTCWNWPRSSLLQPNPLSSRSVAYRVVYFGTNDYLDLGLCWRSHLLHSTPEVIHIS